MNNILFKLDKFFRGDWLLGVLNIKKGLWTVSPKSSNIPYLKAQNANGQHILMQPQKPAQPYFLMADDIDGRLLKIHHKDAAGQWKPGRMVVETSPANYQIWIRSERPLDLHEKLHWLSILKNDPGAHPKNRWGRCPGFRNRKKKYKSESGKYPLSKLVWPDWKSSAHIPIVRTSKRISPVNSQSLSPQPRGFVCQQNDINRSQYNRGNESATDFAYALALARRGTSPAVIYERIRTERTKWDNHRGHKRQNAYLERTIFKAFKIVSLSFTK